MADTTEVIQQLELIPEEFPEAERAFVPITEIIGDLTDEEEVRKFLHRERPEPDFIDSVRRKQLQPIGLIAPKTPGDLYTVNWGRRRIYVAWIIQAERIDSFVYPSGIPGRTIMSIWENIHRSENRVTQYLDVKQIIQDAQELGHMLTPQEVADMIGLSKQSVVKLLRFQNLIPELEQAFIDIRILATHAEAATRLNEENQQRLYEILEDKGRITKDDILGLKLVASQKVFSGFDDQALYPEQGPETYQIPHEEKALAESSLFHDPGVRKKAKVELKTYPTLTVSADDFYKMWDIVDSTLQDQELLNFLISVETLSSDIIPELSIDEPLYVQLTEVLAAAGTYSGYIVILNHDLA